MRSHGSGVLPVNKSVKHLLTHIVLTVITSTVTMSTQNDFNRTSISLENEILVRGKHRAKERRQSFSSYIATLIENDIQRLAAQGAKKRR